jgi:hypothetical protein
MKGSTRLRFAGRADRHPGRCVEASELITSNIVVDDYLGVVDHHFAGLLVP